MFYLICMLLYMICGFVSGDATYHVAAAIFALGAGLTTGVRVRH